jgi:hypothetical protein
MAQKTHLRNRRAVWLAATLLSASPAGAAPDRSVLETALHFFTRDDAAGIVERFDSVRPAPVSPAEREGVLATLPPEGDVRDLDTAQRKKLAAMRRVLELHGRETVYVVKVIEVPQAAVALHARMVVLVSEPALDLLDPEELQALVAHEVGHEYFWSEYFRARRDNDRLLLQTLELLCDGVAIVTLRHAGIEPKRLTSALEKIVRYNRDRFGAALNEDDYTAIGERRRFARRLVEWLGRGGVAGRPPPAVCARGPLLGCPLIRMFAALYPRTWPASSLSTLPTSVRGSRIWTTSGQVGSSASRFSHRIVKDFRDRNVRNTYVVWRRPRLFGALTHSGAKAIVGSQITRRSACCGQGQGDRRRSRSA